MPDDTFYYDAAPSQTVGNLTQRTSGTYTATQFIRGERTLTGDSPGEERTIPVALQYTIPKGTNANVASQMLNSILTSKETPQVSLVGGNPERVRVEWYDQGTTLVNVVDFDAVRVRPEVDDTIYRQLNVGCKMIGNAELTSYTPLKGGSAASCFALQTYRKRPAIWYDLDSTRPLNIPVPKNLDPIITIKGTFPSGDGNFIDNEIVISIFYGVIVCDSAALSSRITGGTIPIGGFWDWAAKILKIVVKVAEVVLPIIETLADPKSGTPSKGDVAHSFASSHPDWHTLSASERTQWLARIQWLVSKANEVTPQLRRGSTRVPSLKRLQQKSKVSAVKRKLPQGQDVSAVPVSATQKQKRAKTRSN